MKKKFISFLIIICLLLSCFSPIISSEKEFKTSNEKGCNPIEITFYNNGIPTTLQYMFTEHEKKQLFYFLNEENYSAAFSLIKKQKDLPPSFNENNFYQLSNKSNCNNPLSSFYKTRYNHSQSDYLNYLCKVNCSTPYFTYSVPQLPYRTMLSFFGGISALFSYLLIVSAVVLSSGQVSNEVLDFLFTIFILSLCPFIWGLLVTYFFFPLQLMNTFLSLRLGWDLPSNIHTNGILGNWSLTGYIETIVLVGFTGIVITHKRLSVFKEYDFYGYALAVYAKKI